MIATDEFPSTGWTNYAELSQPNCNVVRVLSARLNELQFAEQVCVGHSDASPASGRNGIVETLNFIEDVGNCASRLIDSASVSALPVDPTVLFYNKHAPFRDTANPKTTFDIVGLEAWYNQEDRELILMKQLRQTSSDQLQPTTTTSDQPEPDSDLLWTTLTPGPLLPYRFETVRSNIAPWRHDGSLEVSCPFFSTDTVTSRSGGGRGASADCKAIVSAVDTSLISSNTDMHTVVYDPDTHLQPQDVPTSRIVFNNMTASRLNTITLPQGPRTLRNRLFGSRLFVVITTKVDFTQEHDKGWSSLPSPTSCSRHRLNMLQTHQRLDMPRPRLDSLQNQQLLCLFTTDIDFTRQGVEQTSRFTSRSRHRLRTSTPKGANITGSMSAYQVEDVVDELNLKKGM